MRVFYLIALIALCVPGCVAWPIAPACSDAKTLIQQVTEHDEANDKKAHDYTYIEREENSGDPDEKKGPHSETYEVTYLYGHEFRRQIAKDDKPLSAEEAAKEEERIQKRIAKIQAETEKTREEREKQAEKRREENRKFVEEIDQAFNITVLPSEEIAGRTTCVLDLEPRPGYKPHTRESKFLTKIRGRVWIDRGEQQWVKMRVEIIDTISFGLFVARLNKGGMFSMEQTRVNDEVWLPKQMQIQMQARIALVKKFGFAETTTYSNYRKFRTDARILPMGEATQPPQ